MRFYLISTQISAIDGVIPKKFEVGEIFKDKAQGGEGNEAVDNYGDLSESVGNAVFGNLYTQKRNNPRLRLNSLQSGVISVLS